MLWNFVNQVQDIMLLHLNVRIEVRIQMENKNSYGGKLNCA
jgi:hypothetical protein